MKVNPKRWFSISSSSLNCMPASNPGTEDEGGTQHTGLQYSIHVSSVVDQNTLNLDLDPRFWPNVDPDPELCCQV